MSRSDRTRDRFPVINAFGARHEFLGAGADAGETRDGRIRSVWPFLVGRVLAFQKTLTARERVNFDPEDVLTELWVRLAEKDRLWSPERGKYITFVGVVVEHEMGAIRDRARTIHSPRNSTCRLKQYRREEEAGTLTPRRHKTADDIRRTGAGIVGDSCWSRDGRAGADPAESVADAEAGAADLDGLKGALRSLPPLEALVLGRTSGLWGQPRASSWRVAWETGRTHAEVRQAKESALLKVRALLAGLDRTAAAG